MIKNRRNRRLLNYHEDNKYAIIISHSEARGGAKVKFENGVSFYEHEYALMIAKYLYDVADVYTHDGYHRGYRSMCKRTAIRIDKTRDHYDLIVALHFNAGSKPSFHGALALYYGGNELTRMLAKEFSKMMQSDLGIKSRHSRALTGKYDRGYWEIACPRDSVLLLEPFFSTSPIDRRLMLNQGLKYANVIRKVFMKSSYMNEHDIII